MAKRRTGKQKAPQGKVDRALEKLSEADLLEWNRLVKFNANYPDLRDWLAVRGHSVNNQNLSHWWVTNRPRGEKAVALNAIAEKYEGVEAQSVMAMSIGITADLVQILHEQLINREEITSVRPTEKLQYVTNLLKELHTASGNLHKIKTLDEKENLIKSGAFTMAEELRKLFKDSPFAEALEEGIESVLIHLNESQ